MEHVRLETDGPWPVALVAHEGRWISVHSKRDPIAEATQAISAVSDAAPLIVLVGLGLGYALDALERRGWAGRVLAIEVERELIPLMTARRDWSTWNGRLTVLDETALGQDLWREFVGLSDEPPVLVHPVLARTRSGAVQRAQTRAARAWFDHSANESARRANAGRYLLNTLRNLPVLARSAGARELSGLFTGVPAIVIGAGPSLDENLLAMARHPESAVIVAVDTALRPLLAAGIVPHLVVAVDPTEGNARHLCDLPECAETWLVAEGSLDPQALVGFAGRTFFFRVDDHHPWPWLESRGLTPGTLRAWGSVLTTGFDLALRLGADPIIFAGADLAFSKGRPYARNTTNEEYWSRDAAWGVPLEESWRRAVAAWPKLDEPGVGGKVVATAPHLRAFRDWIVQQTICEPSRRFINGTGDGILVGGGIDQANLADTLAGLPAGPTDLRERLAKLACPRAEPFEVGSAIPLADWRQFAPGITDADISVALGTVARIAAPDTDPHVSLERLDARTREIVSRLSHGDQQTIRAILGLDGALVDHVIVHDDTRADLRRRIEEVVAETAGSVPVVLIDALPVAIGAQIRRAAELFVCDHRDAWIEYGRIMDRTSRILVLHPSGAASALASRSSADHTHAEPDRAAAERLMGAVVDTLHPRTLADFGGDAGHRVDVARRLEVAQADTLDATSASTSRSAGPVDVCLCIELAQLLPPDEQDRLIARCTAASDTVVFSSAPPGFPTAGPLAKPLQFWADKFWRHGFVLDDCLRPVIEQRFGVPNWTSDGAVVFRRTLSADAVEHPDAVTSALHATLMAHAWRLHDLYVQSAWWQTEIGRITEHRPTSRIRRLRLPAHRLEPVRAGQRRFRFRTDAARWWCTHHGADVNVLENDRELVRHSAREPLGVDTRGAYVVWIDEITIASTDGSDPRVNRKDYFVRVPEFVALAEERSSIDALDDRFSDSSSSAS